MPRPEQLEVAAPTLSPSSHPGYAAAESVPSQARESNSSGAATIGKSIVVRGEVSGTEALYIEGKVEGAIDLPHNKVTVGRNGIVLANIRALEIVVIGTVRGNCQADGKLDIRGEGSLIGDVIAARISIEEGAILRGEVTLVLPGSKNVQSDPARKSAIAVDGSVLAIEHDKQAEEEIAKGHYQTLDDDGDLEELIPRWRSNSPALIH